MRPYKNQRVQKHCNRCGEDTTHSVTASGRTIGTFRCVPCNSRSAKQSRLKLGNALTSRVCVIHPKNTHRGSSSGVCGCCEQVSRLASSSRKSDVVAKRTLGPDETAITKEFINSLQGSLCSVCLDPVYIIYTPSQPRNPLCLSPSRIHPYRGAHDCNTAHVKGDHFVCNLFRYTNDNNITEAMLKTGAELVLRGGFIDQSLPDATLSTHQRQGVMFGKDLLSRKRSHAKDDGIAVDSEFTYEWLKNTYEIVQKGCCAICGFFLHNDISFDRINPKMGYIKDNINLTHTGCNLAKMDRDVTDLHKMFIISHRNRQVVLLNETATSDPIAHHDACAHPDDTSDRLE